MAAAKCPACGRVTTFHARGEVSLPVSCKSKRCGTTFTACLMGHKFGPATKKRRTKR